MLLAIWIKVIRHRFVFAAIGKEGFLFGSMDFNGIGEIGDIIEGRAFRSRFF